MLAALLLWLGAALSVFAQLPTGPKPAPPTLEDRLWEAVAKDDVKQAEEVLLLGANPNTRRAGDGWTPLMLCVKEDKLGMATQLLKQRADPNSLSEDALKNSALLFSLDKRKDALPWVELLLGAGANPNQMPGTKNYTPLMKAVTINEPEIVEALMRAGADVMLADPQGGTALSRAVGMANPRIIKLLNAETQKHVVKERKPLKLSALDKALLGSLEYGLEEEALTLLNNPETNPNARSAAGYTALMLAVRGAQARAAQRLIDLGANVHAASRDGQPRQVIFFALGAPRRVALLQRLLEMGAEPNAKRPGDGCPVLLEAVRTGPPQAVEALLKMGARPTDKDARGVSARQVVMAGSDPVLVALFRKYADNSIDPAVALSEAPESLAGTQLSSAELEKLAGRDAADEIAAATAAASPLPGPKAASAGKHRMELHLAIAQEDVPRVKELLADGADPNSYDRRGRTPLMTAADITNPDLCRALLESGADPALTSRDDFQAPAIIYAASRKESTETLRVLLEGGSPVDARLAEWYFTPLILSASLQSVENVQLLLRHKADPTLRDKDGRRAVDLAKATKNEQIAALLEEAMAK
jgi:ankyrin repeat protein